MLGFAPIREMLDSGVCVSLGTDGAPSNNRMSIGMLQKSSQKTFLQACVSLGHDLKRNCYVPEEYRSENLIDYSYFASTK
jgi:hypothetical protein